MNTMEGNQEKLTRDNATYCLEEIKKGMHICWNVSAQAGFDSTTIIGDDNKTYATLIKGQTSSDSYKFLGQGQATVAGNHFKIVVSSSAATSLKQVTQKYEIKTEQNRLVGYSYNICIEDYYDDDFNDVCISIVAWLDRG